MQTQSDQAKDSKLNGCRVVVMVGWRSGQGKVGGTESGWMTRERRDGATKAI